MPPASAPGRAPSSHKAHPPGRSGVHLRAVPTWALLRPASTRRRSVSAFGLIFLVVGVGLLVGCFFAFTRTQRFLASAREAQAEVVALQQRLGSGNERSYYP